VGVLKLLPNRFALGQFRMEHGKKNKKFHRESKQRLALMRGLIIALIKNNKIVTTEAKAKSLKTEIERLITKSKKNDLATIRDLSSRIGNESVSKLIKEIGSKYNDRNGGYVRIRKLAPRVSDGSPMAMVELIS
jgi:large subunit ribosomal protein L17